MERQSVTDLFGPVIYSYTRKQAIEDGVLIDVTETANEAGIPLHTVVTCGVWDALATTPAQEKAGQSQTGRLWDVLNVFKWAAGTTGRNSDRVTFKVKISGRNVEMWAKLDPDEDGGDRPVVTIMLIGED